MGILCVCFFTIAMWLWPAVGSGVPSPLIPCSFCVLSFYDFPFLSLSSISFCLFIIIWPYLLLFPWHSMCLFPDYSHVFVPCGEPVPFCRLHFPFVILFSYNVPFLSFSSISFLPIDLYFSCRCSFHGHPTCVFPPYTATCLYLFVACRAIWSSPFLCPRLFHCDFLP